MNADAVFRQWMEIGDRIVCNAQGFSPLEAIYAPERRRSDPFNHLEQSHPALFMTQFAAAKMLQARGLKPDLLVGVSLGEFVAMSIAGMIPFETALKEIARQPEIFRRTSPEGALIAALAPADIRENSPLMSEATIVAGENAENHCVLACQAGDTERVSAELRRLDIPFQRMPVPFAFHSHWIEPARESYLEAVEPLSFETPFWPVWSCCLGSPLKGADGDLLWRIVRDRMQLRATFAEIEKDGGANYIDLSPTGTFVSVLRQTLRGTSSSTVRAVMSPSGGDLKRLDAVLQLVG